MRGTPIDIEYRLHEMAGVAAELARTRAEIAQLELSVGEGLASAYEATRHCYLTETHLPLLVDQVANIGAAIAAADRARPAPRCRPGSWPGDRRAGPVHPGALAVPGRVRGPAGGRPRAGAVDGPRAVDPGAPGEGRLVSPGSGVSNKGGR